MTQAGETTGLESEGLTDYGTNSQAGIGSAGVTRKAADGDAPDAASSPMDAEKLLFPQVPPLQGPNSSPLPSPSIGSVNDRVTVATGHPSVPGAAAGRSRAADQNRAKESRFKTWLVKVGPSWFARAEIQKNHKLILIASFFCVFGFTLCTIGAALTSQPPHALYNLVFLIGGFVILVPGVYYVVYVIRAYKGHDGYSFEDLPPMD